MKIRYSTQPMGEDVIRSNTCGKQADYKGKSAYPPKEQKMRLSSKQFQHVYFHSEYIFDTPPRCDEEVDVTH